MHGGMNAISPFAIRISTNCRLLGRYEEEWRLGTSERSMNAPPRIHGGYYYKTKVAFTVPEKDLFPEGLAYDPAKRVFCIGSNRQHASPENR
jgi:hypothetical protein